MSGAHIDLSRRNLLRAVGAAGAGGFAAGGVATGFLGKVGEKLFYSVFPENPAKDAQKEMVGRLFGASESPPSIFAGSGNLIGATVGLEGLSGYLSFSAGQFSNYVAAAYDLPVKTMGDNSNSSFEYDPNRSSLFLGSPAANHVTSQLMGYVDRPVLVGERNTSMPVPINNNRSTRWSFVYGETGYGLYGGKLQTSFRYSNRTGNLVERPVYKILDKETGELIAPATDGQILQNEWLTIVRIKEFQSYKMIVAGMHGYSSEAFCRNIAESLEQLARIVDGAEQYQVLVPVALSHTKDARGQHYTVGIIDWPSAGVAIFA